MNGSGVVHTISYAVLSQFFCELVSVDADNSNGVLVVDMIALAIFKRRVRHIPQQVRVLSCYPPATGVEFIDMLEFDAQDGGLDVVEATVVADNAVMVAFPAAVAAQDSDLLGHLLRGAGEQAAVTVTAQVLAGKKAETAGSSAGSGLCVVDGGSE